MRCHARGASFRFAAFGFRLLGAVEELSVIGRVLFASPRAAAGRG
jgi:hypothetical protein